MDDDYIVESILAKRKQKKVTEYLVKWEGYDEDEAEWIIESDLAEMDFDEMNEFNRQKEREKEKEKESQLAELKKLQNKSPNTSATNSPKPGGLRNVIIYLRY